jgi:chromosome segregation protein
LPRFARPIVPAFDRQIDQVHHEMEKWLAAREWKKASALVDVAELDVAIGAARTDTLAAASARTEVEAELNLRQQEYHGENMALSSQQRRCHDLELELLQLKQAAEAAERRRAQIAEELTTLTGEETVERKSLAGVDENLRTGRERLEVEMAQRHRASCRYEAEVCSRVASGYASPNVQPGGWFAERSCRDRLAELARRRETLEAQLGQQQSLLTRVTTEREGIDWTPVEAALHTQLNARAATEQALATARDQQEALGASLRAAEETRMVADQKLEPARAKIDEVRLKEHAAALAEQQYAEQLTEAHADIAALPEQRRPGRASALPAIECVAQAIAALGGSICRASKSWRSRRSGRHTRCPGADPTSDATLERDPADRPRVARALHRPSTPSTRISRAFPTLFGGDKRLLTGEEILDSGVQVVAQPPGKRNTSIHLLSGGEKSLTAIALVFALFQINPAPFCLLDEVDAPLDDPNTDRFCALVRTMSDATQFLFISHHKITMEMANQLIGITMPDPGVSRVVAVDIAEALELAEAVMPVDAGDTDRR